MARPGDGAAVATGAERGVVPDVPVDAISTADHPTAARRPARVELEIAPSLDALGLHATRLAGRG